MFSEYVKELNKVYREGNATEHSYRPALQTCLAHLFRDIRVTNEPKRQECGAPDYILTRRKIDIGYIEAKDIGVDLDRVERGSKDDDQWERYVKAFANIILTDYLEFRFYQNGEQTEKIRIGEKTPKGIVPKPENFERFFKLLRDFTAFDKQQTIQSAEKLAKMMAAKAAIMRDVFFKAVSDKKDEESTLKDQLKAFQTVLMHDMDEAQFADVYAQTIAYGLFTARLNDQTKDDFSRGEALTLIPKSNRFLRQLFQYVAGNDLDSRVIWIVDALCEVFRYADLPSILKDFGKAKGKDDPILHFYETFLAEYDPKLRKARGVWYTPEPVVRFIIRAIDDVLKTHFGLKEGLAHTGKVEIKVDGHAGGKPVKVKEQVHKVQLLDVATGTGTFLAEVVKQLHAGFKGQEGLWGDYVEKNLLPRMHGFELLMASYAMCHMKLDLLLKQTGYQLVNSPHRLGVYLTNSLEEQHKDSHLPFVNWLSQEANAASRIKREMPIMVAFGNPPYSGHSSNNGEWIQKLIEDYKKEPGGKIKLKEKNPKWLNDDYVKFIRLGEYYIERNGEGILAYITNHSYLDNPTFRGMRWHLLNTFDDIYILDLHGNAKKKETALDGSPDRNVFDIQQGVALIVALKSLAPNSGTKALAHVHHKDIRGEREYKYDYLDNAVFKNIRFQVLRPSSPYFMLVPRDETLLKEYQAWPGLSEMMKTNVLGFQTHRDHFAVDFDKKAMTKKVMELRDDTETDENLRAKYNLVNNHSWQLSTARESIKSDSAWEKNIIPCSYRPFDNRTCYFSDVIIDRPRKELLQNVAGRENLCLGVGKQGQAIPERPWELVYSSNHPIDANIFRRGGINVFPLYIYEEVLGKIESKRPNFEPKIYQSIKKIVPDAQPQSLFDYIYAVLHSRAYRQRYAEFLKSDFPRIPYPKDSKIFHALAEKGAEIRALHLMESPALEKTVTAYPVGGDHEVGALRWEGAKNKADMGRVWINTTQYFDKVPLVAWTFFIGGYQPAQKWLKDRKGRKLSSEDIIHWQRIVVALKETDRVMGEIEKIKFLP